MQANRKAFLDAIAYAEGTDPGHPLSQDRGYDVIVTGVDGPEIFTDYRHHPFFGGRKSRVINSKGLTSNASGRYQFMLKDYLHYVALLHLPDFGPESQDRQKLLKFGPREFSADGNDAGVAVSHRSPTPRCLELLKSRSTAHTYNWRNGC